MTTGELIQVILMGLLVLVTGIYAWRTFAISKAAEKQAKANIEMAKEMKGQRLSMYKPHILLKNVSATKGKHFMKEISIAVRNEQGGTAINVKLQVHHPRFEFSTSRYPFPISVGQDQDTVRSCHVERPSVDEDTGIPIDPVALVIANYEDVSGNPWHSVLELHWDATSKDVTPKRTQVAVPGPFHSGENIND